jgi:membrane protein required for colicin V production
MNLLDMLIIATVLFFAVRGVFRGFFRETASLAGVVLGIWLGSRFQPQVTQFLQAHIPFVKILPLVSFALIFLVVLIICNLAAFLARIAFRMSFFGWVDRTLGAGVAVLKGIVIIYLAMVLLTVFVPAKAPLIAGSRLAPFIIHSYQSIITLVSPESYRRLKRGPIGRAFDQTLSAGAKGIAETDGLR